MIQVNLYNIKKYHFILILQTWANHLIYGLNYSHLQIKRVRPDQYFATDVREIYPNTQRRGRTH